MCCKLGHHAAVLFAACLCFAAAQGGRGGARGGYRGGGAAAGVGAGIGAGIAQDNAGKGDVSTLIAIAIIAVGMVILFALTAYIKNNEHSSSEEEQRPLISEDEGRGSVPPPSRLVSAVEYIRNQSAAAIAPAKQLPSGTWRGYYNQYGFTHAVCEFNLVINGDTVRGSGVDDVGSYSIDGLYGEGTGRLAFQKRYVRGSKATNGRVSRENLGHGVEYRGECAGPDLGQGVRGLWYVETAFYKGWGRFHIWPVVDLQSPEAAAAGAAFVRTHPTFKVSADNVCAVCFDRPIDVLVDPCGHIVMCATCAGRVNPRKCPICRVDIKQILPAEGSS